MSKYALLAIGVAAVLGGYLFTTDKSDSGRFATQTSPMAKKTNDIGSEGGHSSELPRQVNINQLESDSCLQFVAQPDEFKELSIQYRNDIRSLRQALSKQLSPELQRQWLAQVGLATTWLTFDALPSLQNNKQRIELDAAQIQSLLGLLSKEQYNELAEKGRINELPFSASINGQTLLSSVIDLKPTIALDALNTLLSAGFEVDLGTLYFATRAGVTSEHLARLLQYAQVDVSSTWHDEGQTYSLASTAASIGLAELAQFWFERGSPLVDNSQQLVSSNRVPWQTLSKESALAFISLFSHAFVGDVLLTPADYRYLQTLLGAENLMAAAPFVKQGDQINLDEVIEGQEAMISQLVATEARLDLYSQCDRSYQDKLEGLAASLNGLEAMKRRGLHSLYKNITILADEPELYKKIDAALQDQRWEEALQWLLQLPMTSENRHQFEYALTTMLVDSAPLSVLEQLLTSLADIPPSLLFTAASVGNNRVIHLLEQQGVDLHGTNRHGENALQLAIMSTVGTENHAVEYLLNLGISPMEGKVDSLMVLIKSASRLNEEIVNRYIALLMEHGASVTPAHLEEINTNKRLSEVMKSKLLRMVAP